MPTKILLFVEFIVGEASLVLCYGFRGAEVQRYFLGVEVVTGVAVWILDGVATVISKTLGCAWGRVDVLEGAEKCPEVVCGGDCGHGRCWLCEKWGLFRCLNGGVWSPKKM